MKGELLSIGEVSKMKGVGVKSLRYYERMGVLPPAYVDPDSGYRYYSMRQMVDIDIITTCIDLGIPLRELRDHMDESGTADLEPRDRRPKPAQGRNHSEPAGRLP